MFTRASRGFVPGPKPIKVRIQHSPVSATVKNFLTLLRIFQVKSETVLRNADTVHVTNSQYCGMVTQQIMQMVTEGMILKQLMRPAIVQTPSSGQVRWKQSSNLQMRMKLGRLWEHQAMLPS